MNNKVLYHGSPKNFTKFDYDKINSNAGTSGAGIGFYFSNMIDGALRYGDYIYEVNFPVGKEISNFNRTLSNFKLNEILKHVYKKSGDNYYENWNENVNPLNLKRMSFLDNIFPIDSTDTEIIMSIINAGNSEVKLMLEALIKNGYTYTTDLLEHGISSSIETHYILYNEPKILKKYKYKK